MVSPDHCTHGSTSCLLASTKIPLTGGWQFEPQNYTLFLPASLLIFSFSSGANKIQMESGWVGGVAKEKDQITKGALK